MKCQNCGEELREAAKFCPKCGHDVSSEMSPGEHAGMLLGDTDAIETHDAIGEAAPSGEAETSSAITSWCKPPVIGLLAVIILACLVYAAATMGDNGASSSAFLLEDIKDDAFRTYIQENIDSDDDGMISRAEADAVDAIGSVDNSGNVTDAGLSGCGVESLEGIEHFENLATLVCDDNALASLDVSENPNLVYLSCRDNELSELSLPDFGSLVVLHATNNRLSTVDLSTQTELRDVELDSSVDVRGTEGPSDEETKAKIEDLALVFAFARGLFSGASDGSGDLVVGPGVSADIDNVLIEAVLSTAVFPTRNLDYVLEYLPDIAYDEAGMISVPRAQGESVIRSVYGSVPDDLSYLFAGNGLATYLGDEGWYVFPAQGDVSYEISTDNWVGYGRLVSFDAVVFIGTGPAVLTAPRQMYRVTVIEDEESMFGYHLVSMVSLGAEEGVVANGAGEGSESDDDSSSEEMVDSIVQWAESEQRGSSSSSVNSSNRTDGAEESETWPDFDQLPGTWLGTLRETEHNSVMDQAACYGGRAQPLTVTFKSVDAAGGTAVVDMRALIHSHGELKNAAEQADGDHYVELTDVLVTLRKNSNTTYRVYEGRDVGSYYINFCFSEDGSFVAEVYTEAKVTNPFVAWRRDTFDMKKQ